MNLATRPRRGYSLMEMLAVMWGLTIALGLGIAILLGAMRLGQAAARGHDRLLAGSQLADRFRADVAGAAEAPEWLDERPAGSDSLLLRRPDGTCVAYRVRPGLVERAEGTSDAALSWHSALHLPEDGHAAFRRPTAPGGPAVLVLSEGGKGRGLPRETIVAAALGGDLR